MSEPAKVINIDRARTLRGLPEGSGERFIKEVIDQRVKDSELLENVGRRQKRRSAKRNRTAEKIRRAEVTVLSAAALAVGAGVAIAANHVIKGERAPSGHVNTHKSRNRQILDAAAPFLPHDDEVYRVLTVGETRDGIVLTNTGSIIDYILKKSGGELKDNDVANVVEAQNIQYQIDRGVKEAAANRLTVVAPGQIRLPETWGIGDKVAPQEIVEKQP